MTFTSIFDSTKKLVILLLVMICTYQNLLADINLYQLNALIPKNTTLRNRVLTTISCKDCSHIPKVQNAGKVFNLKNSSSYQLMHNGLKILKDCYYGEWMTTIIEILKGHHEPQEEKVFYEVLKYMPDNAVMLELGSYWGYYSMWFQKDVKNATNYLIEPDPVNIEIGKRNFQLNNMHGIFTQASIGANDKPNVNFTDWDYNNHIVKQVCMDDFVEQHQIPFIHILHSDIQGAEVNMLKGCKKLIAKKRIGYFFVSTHRGVHEDCLKILKESGYKIIVSHTREESFSADGLIVAKLPNIDGANSIHISRRTPEFINNINDFLNNNITQSKDTL